MEKEDKKQWLLQEIEEQEKKLIELRDQRRKIEKDIEQIGDWMRSYRTVYAKEFGHMPINSRLNKQRFSEMSINDAAFEILGEIEKAHTKVITDKIIEGGKNIGGEKPHNVVASSMRQDKRFKNLGKNVFIINPEYRQKNAPIV